MLIDIRDLAPKPELLLSRAYVLSCTCWAWCYLGLTAFNDREMLSSLSDTCTGQDFFFFLVGGSEILKVKLPVRRGKWRRWVYSLWKKSNCTMPILRHGDRSAVVGNPLHPVMDTFTIFLLQPHKRRSSECKAIGSDNSARTWAPQGRILLSRKGWSPDTPPHSQG